MTLRLRYPAAVVLTALTLPVTLVHGVSAAPPPKPDGPAREFGNGPDRTAQAGRSLAVRTFGQDAKEPRWHPERGYPRHTKLPEPPENPADKSIKLGLAPYHAIAPKLNALQRRSNRVSAEIIGRTHSRRDLYLVTVTMPESSAESRRQSRIRSKIENRPAQAARDPQIKRRYKTPVFINNNIHGDEWEGTDASLREIERLATGSDRATKDLLARNRLYFNVTANPDGRVAGVRQNGAGFDLNRDFVTGSQPEGRAMRQVMRDTQPAAMLDLHGYVNGTLIEPTTPPHGQNYEYDLFIKNTYANGLNMERAVKALGHTPEKDGVQPPQIPFRDSEEGWDDWPPIFTPQYAPFHGTVAAHTVEIPLRVNRGDYNNLPVEELRRRSKINTDIAGAAITSTLSQVQEQRSRLIADQIEVFRRGAAGEPSKVVPLGIVPGFGPEDQYNTKFPRAYVIPVGSPQRSHPAAVRLVRHLIDNDVRVQRARRAFSLGGKRYPAGSYIVDMHQPKRGMANVMLEPGADISPRVDTMYDISGWSLADLWGASVNAVSRGGMASVSSQAVRVAGTGSVPSSGDVSLALNTGDEVAALNALLAQGVKARLTADGKAWIPGSARSSARSVAGRYGVRFEKAPGGPTQPMGKLTVAVAGGNDELYTLREMGFDVRPVSTQVLNDGFAWKGVDALYVGAGLRHQDLNDKARAALNEFLARGGVVTRGAEGAEFNSAAGLLTAKVGLGREDANGTVSVVNGRGPVTSGAPRTSFVYSPLWFSGLGTGVSVEQRYAAKGPLIAGHWRADSDGNGGPDKAAGQPSIVSGVDERGARVVMFGTEPLFRNHPKGLFAQVARGLYWSAASGT